mmetsp:Transcript_11966/g.17882  ORF Transcript_11966/g.17882 Transcript_11966/m.17882 type:complete len:134 (+) Transcript_11966:276-677(+)
MEESILNEASREVLEKWNRENTIKQIPPNTNDDWYWMWLAIRNGSGCLVVSNDEGRDHKFGMLQPFSFDVWTERHQVYFKFGKWKDGRRQILVDEPPLYSKRVQFEGGHWHVPVEESNDWLCVRKKSNGNLKG